MKPLIILCTLIILCQWNVLSQTPDRVNLSSASDKILPGEFAHIVFFWLKRPDNKNDRAAFEASLEKFISNSKYIYKKHLGTPASTRRDVIDSSYTYCLLLTFKSEKDQNAYQDEKVHKIFIKESEDLWETVKVYDSINFW